MNNVIGFTGSTTVDIPPDAILEKAKSWGMEHCIIVGHGDDGELFFGGTTSDVEKILMLLERAKTQLLVDLAKQYNGGFM